ncbi:MAG: toll/interleukin-1 receptor domain-containing protein [Luteimonas sp.]|nr:toll/interleukin-1 receptor domain-containing protein [Luteimonas sp.]
MRFGAFLSYSHDDAPWARWLLRRLETYRVPTRLVGTQGAHGVIGPRLGIVFRDREELPTAGDLGATIRTALADSAALIVICSPAAARSRWVNAEVEAFHAGDRGDRVLCFVVAGVPGSNDPAQQCFPPALSQADADGVAREPLAADARRDGDGRERAFLKLVAGLLGVGYDALARREAQRRQRRLAIVAVASLAGMAIALGLAATAYVARNDAQRRQAQAEDILGFMLGDLRKKLTTVGRLDLMRTVDDKATGYFATLDPRDISDRALEEQARSLTGIGEVRLSEGNHDAAMSAFREAHARSTALHRRAPDNGQRLFDLAQAEYWIGFVAWQQGRLDDAQVWLRKYRDSAVRLAAMDRGNFDWQKEVMYGHHNLAVLAESRGRYVEAENGMRQVLEMHRAWSRERPMDAALRGEGAETMSWLGRVSALQGKLMQAEAFFTEEVDAFRRNTVDEPKNAKWKQQLNDALLILAKVQVQRGRLAEARVSVGAAVPLIEALAGSDASNSEWQTARGIARWWQAQLASGTPAPAAEKLVAESVSILENVRKKEPRNERVRNWLIKAKHHQARLALGRDDVADARASLADSVRMIEPAWRSSPNETLRQLYAEHLLLSGESLHMSDQPQSAKAAWRRAGELLLADESKGLPFERLEPLVRTLLHLSRTEQSSAYQQRLSAAGFVPLRPWSTTSATTEAQTDIAAR